MADGLLWGGNGSSVHRDVAVLGTIPPVFFWSGRDDEDIRHRWGKNLAQKSFPPLWDSRITLDHDTGNSAPNERRVSSDSHALKSCAPGITPIGCECCLVQEKKKIDVTAVERTWWNLKLPF